MSGSVILGMQIFTLQNDLEQSQLEDSLCIFRGYMVYVMSSLQYNSYLLQATYRYINAVYPARVHWQSERFQLFLICFTWILAFMYPIPHRLTHAIRYNIDNQVCQMPLQFSFLTVYNNMFIYIVSIMLTVLIYFKLVRYVRIMSTHITPVNTLARVQRELKMVRRIVIIIMAVVTIGFPYVLFTIMSFFTTPPKYHFRSAFIFGDASLVFVTIALFKFTEPLKTST